MKQVIVLVIGVSLVTPVFAQQPCPDNGEGSSTRTIAPDYGQREPAPMLVYSATVHCPWRILTLLLPDAQGLSSPPAVRLIYNDQNLPAGLHFEQSGEFVRVDERAVLVERV